MLFIPRPERRLLARNLSAHRAGPAALQALLIEALFLVLLCHRGTTSTAPTCKRDGFAMPL